MRERRRQQRVDAWLAAGGVVLAANERAARSIASGYHAARMAEGRRAWPTPAIYAWETWLREQWTERNEEGLLLLNPLQERAVWAWAIRAAGKNAAAEGLPGLDSVSSGRLAMAAQQAYRLLCGNAPKALRAQNRAGWMGDAATFSVWAETFETRCRREGLLSTSRMAVELAGKISVDEPRAPLLLVGFDRLLPSQEGLLAAWGSWERDETGENAEAARFVSAEDTAGEMEACVGWLRDRLSENPQARLMVVTTGLEERRGELERALLAGETALEFEFSLGVALGQVGLVRGALLLLRWMVEPLSEAEIDWLIGSGVFASDAAEELALAKAIRALRSRDRERPEWEPEVLAAEMARTGATGEAGPLERIVAAKARLAGISRQSALAWAAVAEELLTEMEWPGFRPLGTVAFQARRRWERVLEEAGSLGFDGSTMEWGGFVAALGQAVAETIFAPESRDAQVLVTGPLESAGQVADGVWFLGASEDDWPGRGQPNPLLPVGLQRETGMPHASAQGDWDVARAATERLTASADEVIFSFARMGAEAEARPSRLVVQTAGVPASLPPLASREIAGDRTEEFLDFSTVRFPLEKAAGGAGTLTRQSLCPFQAFGVARLGAEGWKPAEAGLNARQRGELLHRVLHRVWGGTTEEGRCLGGISTLEELLAIARLEQFVGRIVAGVMRESFDETRRNSLPNRFPGRYLELETERLTRLVVEWLEYEKARSTFRVLGTEIRTEVMVAGLSFRLRLDRVDAVGIDPLGGIGTLIVDYKSGSDGPSKWKDERPEDVQLPLYATFAAGEDLEGLVFARVRPGKMEICGRARNARTSIRADLDGRNGLVKDPLTEEQLGDWRRIIERLGEEFVAGRAEVDPREPGKTCERCHLHAVCRIYEQDSLSAMDEDEDGSGDE